MFLPRFRLRILAISSCDESCILSSFEHFDLNIISGDKVYRLVTVYRPPPSKKNGFTVEKFFSEFSAF